MSAGGGYNDWETDLSSIIEKTNQNLKLLRRIGEKRSDLSSSQAYDVSTTTSVRPTSAAQIASEMRSFASSISSRYAAEDAAANARARSSTGIPRAAAASAASASSRKLNRSSSVGVDARERARESLIIRPPAPTQAFGSTSDGEAESDERVGSPRPRHGVSSRSSSMKRTSAVTGRAKSSTSSRATSSGGSTTNDIRFSSSDHTAAAVEELRKSLEVHIASRSSTFEKALSDLRVDMSGVTAEANALAMRMNELRDSVTGKLSSLTTLTQASSEHGESIGRLEKHSAVLLGWKVGVDQDLFEITNKMKSFASIQEKMTSLEGHLEALGTTIKTTHRAARYDEKIEEVKDRVAVLERLTAQQLDTKAVEHTVQMRVTREINDLEGRINQSLAFLAQKLETKLQTLEKAVASDRIDAIAALKNDLIEDIDKVESKAVKKQEVAVLQSAHNQMKEDIAHFQLFFERQDKRFQELKQNATQIRDELVETRQELTKALHSQQHRVSTTLEEKVAQLTVISKDKNANAEQHVRQLEKRQKKLEDQCIALHEGLSKVKQNAITQRAADAVSQQRENEKLRQRLVRSLAELEQIHSAKQEVERTHESKEKLLQSKLNELLTQVDEQERAKESQRAELMQAIQNESKQLGIVQGKNALLEKLLEKEKVDRDKKTEQLHKSRLEIMQVRQKMRVLENEVDKKMQKLSSELHAKQLQVDTLLKRLKRSEDEVAKLDDSAKRERKQLSRTKELKQQELHMAHLKLKEFEKMAVNAVAAKDAEAVASERTAVSVAQMNELEMKRKELEHVLTEREADLKEMKADIDKLTAERETMMKQHKETVDITFKEASEKFEAKISELELCIRKKDDDIRQLQENLVERSELLALEGLLSSLQNEKETLVEELRRDQQRKLDESESLLSANYKAEIVQLMEQLGERAREIQEANCAVKECRDRIATLEREVGSKDVTYKDETSRLTNELRMSKHEAEQLIQQISEVEEEKRLMDRKLEELELQLEVASRRDEQQQQEMDDLRQDFENLTSERQTLIQSLDAKSRELDELVQSEERCRARLAEVVRDQEEIRIRLESEINELQATLTVQSESSAAERRSLESTIEMLTAQLATTKKESEEGTKSANNLHSEIERLVHQLSQARDRELHLDSMLSGVIQELTALAIASPTECETDPASAIRRYVEAAGVNVKQLVSLADEHQRVMTEAASQRARAHQLDLELEDLSHQLQQVEASNRELKAELETVYAESAKHSDQTGRLNEDIDKLREEKHLLQEQVEKLMTECENFDANAKSERKEKDFEITELREANAELERTIESIRDTMERIETNKMLQLDTLSSELQELEVKLLTATSESSIEVPTSDRDFFANQQLIASHGQAIRVMYAKLLSGCSVVDIHELKAAITGMESKLHRLREEYTRERQKCTDEEDEVLFSLDFLESLLSESNENAWSTVATKYVKTVPSLVSRLQRIQQLYMEVLRQSDACGSDPQCLSDESADWDARNGPEAGIDDRIDDSDAVEGAFDENDASVDEDDECSAEASSCLTMSDDFQADLLQSSDMPTTTDDECDVGLHRINSMNVEHSEKVSGVSTSNDTSDDGCSAVHVGNDIRYSEEMPNTESVKSAGDSSLPERADGASESSTTPSGHLSTPGDRTSELTLRYDEFSVLPQHVDPCTMLPSSPTSHLRQDPFVPLPSSSTTADVNNSNLKHTATADQVPDDYSREIDGSPDKDGEIESDDENVRPESSAGEEEEEESLSESLESMIRLAGDTDHDGNHVHENTLREYDHRAPDRGTELQYSSSLSPEVGDEDIALEDTGVDEESYDQSLDESSDENVVVGTSTSSTQIEREAHEPRGVIADKIDQTIGHMNARGSEDVSARTCSEDDQYRLNADHSSASADVGDAEDSEDGEGNEDDEDRDREVGNGSVSSHDEDDPSRVPSSRASIPEDQYHMDDNQVTRDDRTRSFESRSQDANEGFNVDAHLPASNLAQIAASRYTSEDESRRAERAMGSTEREIVGEETGEFTDHEDADLRDHPADDSELDEQSLDAEDHELSVGEGLNAHLSHEGSPEQSHYQMSMNAAVPLLGDVGTGHNRSAPAASHRVACQSDESDGDENEDDVMHRDKEEAGLDVNADGRLSYDRMDRDHSGTSYTDVNDEGECTSLDHVEIDEESEEAATPDDDSHNTFTSTSVKDTSTLPRPAFDSSLRMEGDEDESDGLIDSSDSEGDERMGDEDDSEQDTAGLASEQHSDDTAPRDEGAASSRPGVMACDQLDDAPVAMGAPNAPIGDYRLDDERCEDPEGFEIDDEGSIDRYESGEEEPESTNSLYTESKTSSSYGFQDRTYGGTDSSLMKALQVSRTLGGISVNEIDDDMDENERLLVSETLQQSRASPGDSHKRRTDDDDNDAENIDHQTREEQDNVDEQEANDDDHFDGQEADDGDDFDEQEADDGDDFDGQEDDDGDDFHGQDGLLRDEMSLEDMIRSSEHKSNYEADGQRVGYAVTNVRSSGLDISGTRDEDADTVESKLEFSLTSQREDIEEHSKAEEGELGFEGEGEDDEETISRTVGPTIKAEVNDISERWNDIKSSRLEGDHEQALENRSSLSGDLQSEDEEEGDDMNEESDAVDSSFGEDDLERLLEARQSGRDLGYDKQRVEVSTDSKVLTAQRIESRDELSGHQEFESLEFGRQQPLYVTGSHQYNVAGRRDTSVIGEKHTEHEADLEESGGAGISSFGDDELEVAILTGVNHAMPTRGTESRLISDAAPFPITPEYRVDDSDYHIEEETPKAQETESGQLTHVEERGEDDECGESIDEASGVFGSSFADDDLERALEGRTDSREELSHTAQETSGFAVAGPKDSPTTDTGGSASNDSLGATQRSRIQRDVDSDEDEEAVQQSFSPTTVPAPSSFLMGRGIRQPLTSLTGLTKPALSLGVLGRSQIHSHEDDDDDMDEVERLLLEQTSMRAAAPQTGVKTSTIGTRRFDDGDDDDIDAPNTGAPESPLRRADLPIAHDDDDEFAHFDRDDDDGDDDHEAKRPVLADREGSLSALSDSASSAPSSPSRIPILPGSSLLKKTAASVVARQQSPVQRQRMTSEDSEDDGADAYLEESFDLEESIQEDEEDA